MIPVFHELVRCWAFHGMFWIRLSRFRWRNIYQPQYISFLTGCEPVMFRIYSVDDRSRNLAGLRRKISHERIWNWPLLYVVCHYPVGILDFLVAEDVVEQLVLEQYDRNWVSRFLSTDTIGEMLHYRITSRTITASLASYYNIFWNLGWWFKRNYKWLNKNWK